MKKFIAILLAFTMCIPMVACGGKSEAVANCEKLISEIGEVTLDSNDAIIAAENAFAALSDEEKEALGDVATTITNSRDTYEQLVKIDEVIVKIDSIGEVTFDSGDVISSARELYNSLPADSKAQVSNLEILEKAEAKHNEIAKAEKEKIKKEYMSRFDIETDKVEKLTWYLPKNLPDYIDTRSYIIPYIGLKNGNPWIIIRYNYTADDWIFWENMKIISDEKEYYKSVGPFGTVRDNQYGNIWEYYEESLNYNQPLGSDELQMLKQISESNETIIRFQGDDYYDDLVVTKADKDMIKDVLKLYSALLS